MSRKGPEKSATLYKQGTKKVGNDGNTWVVQENKNGINRWVLFKKPSKKLSNNSTKKTKKSEKSFSDFTKSDFAVFDIIYQYKSTYELIMNKSLEYKINLKPENSGTTNITKITYEKISNNTKKYKAEMCVFGQLIKNTFTWNPYLRLTLLNNKFDTFTKEFQNKKTIQSLRKLLLHNVITFPEKYKDVIPYFISFNFDPKITNVIRFVNPTSTIYTYIFIHMPLDIPYWVRMTQHIYDALTSMKGGSLIIEEPIKEDNILYNISHKNELFSTSLLL